MNTRDVQAHLQLVIAKELEESPECCLDDYGDRGTVCNKLVKALVSNLPHIVELAQMPKEPAFDVNECLEQVLDIVASFGAEIPRPSDDGWKLSNLIAELHEHLTNGGVFPNQWLMTREGQ